jgi:hypothetical protein
MTLSIPEELRNVIPPLHQGAVMVEDAETRHRYLILEIESTGGHNESRPIPLDCLPGLIAQLAEPPEGDDWPSLTAETAARAWGDEGVDPQDAPGP